MFSNADPAAASQLGLALRQESLGAGEGRALLPAAPTTPPGTELELCQWSCCPSRPRGCRGEAVSLPVATASFSLALTGQYCSDQVCAQMFELYIW